MSEMLRQFIIVLVGVIFLMLLGIDRSLVRADDDDNLDLYPDGKTPIFLF
jgi:hypothetical protein